MPFNFLDTLENVRYAQFNATDKPFGGYDGSMWYDRNAAAFKVITNGGVVSTLGGGASGISNQVIPVGTGGGLANSLLTDNGTTLTYTGTGGIVSAPTGAVAGVLSLNGSTSGVATFTAPAVAGTPGNAVASSNAIQFPNGAANAPSICSAAACTNQTGIFFNGNSVEFSAFGSATHAYNFNAAPEFTSGSAGVIDWSATTSPQGGIDTGISRAAAGVVAIGKTATSGDTTGTLKAASYMSVGTTFTASGCTNSTLVGGATAGRFTVGQNTACTIVITMGNAASAPNGWSCTANDQTAVPAVAIRQTASNATTASLLMTVATNDVVSFNCIGY